MCVLCTSNGSNCLVERRETPQRSEAHLFPHQSTRRDRVFKASACYYGNWPAKPLHVPSIVCVCTSLIRIQRDPHTTDLRSTAFIHPPPPNTGRKEEPSHITPCLAPACNLFPEEGTARVSFTKRASPAGALQTSASQPSLLDLWIFWIFFKLAFLWRLVGS